MSVKDVVSECWILTLFVREDGQRLLLGSGDYAFRSDQQHFSANLIVNDTVDVQGGDGTYIIGQVRRAQPQVFEGYVGDGSYSKQQVE